MPSPQGAVVASARFTRYPERNALRAIPPPDPRLGNTVGADSGWQAELREILAEFDNDCCNLSRSCDRLLRRQLATQIEQEVLRFADPNKQAVLSTALKHFNSL